MSKIKPIIMRPGQGAKIFTNSMALMHGTKNVDAQLPKVKPEVRSTLDLSTEELGFFMHNGKVVNIIFPR